eukprot:scaffold1559_cov114-Cylindrotheca_fusiformis.AAC.13
MARYFPNLHLDTFGSPLHPVGQSPWLLRWMHQSRPSSFYQILCQSHPETGSGTSRCLTFQTSQAVFSCQFLVLKSSNCLVHLMLKAGNFSITTEGGRVSMTRISGLKETRWLEEEEEEEKDSEDTSESEEPELLVLPLEARVKFKAKGGMVENFSSSQEKYDSQKDLLYSQDLSYEGNEASSASAFAFSMESVKKL